MRHAIIETGKVVNTALATAEYGQIQGWIPSETAGIGDSYSYVTGEFTRPAPPPPTPEQLLVQAKKERTAAVAAIKVTTASGKVFDGDEVSQTRMARSIIALEAMGAPSVKWVLANNVPTDVTVAELTEALALAGAAQAAVWSAPYGVA